MALITSEMEDEMKIPIWLGLLIGVVTVSVLHVMTITEAKHSTLAANFLCILVVGDIIVAGLFIIYFLENYL